MVNCINLIIEMSPRFVDGRENVPCVAEVVNRSLKADCTDFTLGDIMSTPGRYHDKCGGRPLGKQLNLYGNPSVLNIPRCTHDIPPVY